MGDWDYTPGQLARELGIDPAEVWRALERGELVARRRGGRLVVNVWEAARWFQERTA